MQFDAALVFAYDCLPVVNKYSTTAHCTPYRLLCSQFTNECPEKSINLIKEPPPLLFEFKSNLQFSHFKIPIQLNFESLAPYGALSYSWDTHFSVNLSTHSLLLLCFDCVCVCVMYRIRSRLCRNMSRWALNEVDVHPISLIMHFSYSVIN